MLITLKLEDPRNL